MRMLCVKCGDWATTRYRPYPTNPRLWMPAHPRCAGTDVSPIPRIGPTMASALMYIDRHEGATKLEVGRAIWPQSPTRHGWPPVQRLLGAGLAHDTGRRGRASLHLTPAGVIAVESIRKGA